MISPEILNQSYKLEKKWYASRQTNKKESSPKPWLVVNYKDSLGGNSMSSSCKHAKMHAVARYHRRRHETLLTSRTPNTYPKFSIITPAKVNIKQKSKLPTTNSLELKEKYTSYMKLIYLKNTKASPATNLFEVTNVLHPVVSKCLRGWPN